MCKNEGKILGIQRIIETIKLNMIKIEEKSLGKEEEAVMKTKTVMKRKQNCIYSNASR